MKRILLLCFILFINKAFSQSITYRSSDVITVSDARLQAQKNFFVPRYNDTTLANSDKGVDSCGAIIYVRANNSFYYRACSPKRWLVLYSSANQGVSIDSLKRSSDSIYARKNGVFVFQYRDSVGGGGGSTDTTSLSNRINARVQYIDTSAMLSPYFRRSLSANDTIKTNGKVLEMNATRLTKSTTLKIDTLGITADVTSGLNTSDFLMATNVLSLSQINGVSTNLISMQPNVGVDISSANATTTDGINVTSNVGAFWYVDSYDTIGILPRTNGVAGQVLKLQNGAQMVWANDSTGGVDTTSLSARIDARIKYTDSSSMLAPYLRNADTSSLSSRINGKLSIADTSSLQPKQLAAYSFQANGTSAAANGVATYFKDTSGTYTGAIAWTGTTAPSGTTNHSYRWTRVGKCVTLNVNLIYATNGGALTAVVFDLPSDAPTPAEPAGLTGASQNMYPVLVWNTTATNTLVSNAARGFLRNNAANNAYEFVVNITTSAVNSAYVTLNYWTN